MNYWKANEKNPSYLRMLNMKIILSSKRHHYVAIVSIFLVAAALIVGMVGCGSPPIAIHDWYDLDAIRNNLGGSYLLMNDLDSTTAGYEELASPTAKQGRGWDPIVIFVVTHGYYGFEGAFDGQGYEIRDLFINRPGESHVGLFGEVGGVIKNIGVVNVTVTGSDYAGGLVGFNGGIVSNSHSTGNVTGDVRVGGLVGYNEGTVSNSYSSGDVTGGAESWSVGGLVGGNDATVSNSYACGSVTGTNDVGGLVGVNAGTVSNSYSTGSVTGNEDVGGLVGINGGPVSNSFWDTETSGQATSDGGTGKNTTEMQDIATFTDTETEGLDEPWDITAVANPSIHNLSYIWNIVDDQTYPFLSWQS